MSNNRNSLLIDLDTLLPLKQFMSREQLARYDEYLKHLEPLKPFTWEEIEELRRTRDELIRKSNESQDSK
jgi:hypothetical protein